MRLIDADAFIDDLYEYEFSNWCDKDEVSTLVNDALSIDIEPKRGEWIDMGDFEQCSVCKGTRLKEFQTYYGKAIWIKTSYCPNCGADMRKGVDDEAD